MFTSYLFVLSQIQYMTKTYL